jgi:hypothetical protein
VTGPGSYRLQTLEGENVSNSWNIDQLWGLKFARLLQDPFAVSGPWVQALVSGLLYSKIQRSQLLKDLGLLKATKDSSSGLLKDHVLLDSAYTATNGSTAIRGYAP